MPKWKIFIMFWEHESWKISSEINYDEIILCIDKVLWAPHRCKVAWVTHQFLRNQNSLMVNSIALSNVIQIVLWKLYFSFNVSLFLGKNKFLWQFFCQNLFSLRFVYSDWSEMTYDGKIRIFDSFQKILFQLLTILELLSVRFDLPSKIVRYSLV